LIFQGQGRSFLIKLQKSMNFDKQRIIQEFKLHKFGSKGWYNSTSLKCKECGRFDKFGINFEENQVHCFYDNYRSKISFYLKDIGRSDLILFGEDSSMSLDFPSFLEAKTVEIEETTLPIKKLPIGFRRLQNDAYLNDRNFLPQHYEIFRVGETKLDPTLRNCLIFQFMNNKGECIAWMSRTKKGKEWHKNNLEKYKLGLGELVLRYGNSPNTDFSKILGGNNEITDNTDTLILVEGIMDKTSVDKKLDLFRSEGTKCCFTFGNKVSLEQIRIINSYKNIENIFLMYDYGTNSESCHNGLVMLDNLKGKKVRVCEILEKNLDPGDMTKDQILKVLDLSVDAFEFKYSVFNGIN
jgi:hypothetical protein